EVAKAMNCGLEEVDKELVLGILLSASELNDIERIKYIKAGRWFLAQMDGRQK
ncbi:conjugal transfer protein TraD, partial [Salmonella enterica]|nr:conjugal transfer protein TraD [Salmonella enterica]